MGYYLIAPISFKYAERITSLEGDDSDVGSLLATLREESVSDYIVAFLRMATSAFLRNHAEEIQPFIADGRTVADFCAQVCALSASPDRI